MNVKVTWTGGAQISNYLKDPHEDQVYGYDALLLVYASTSVYLIFAHKYVE